MPILVILAALAVAGSVPLLAWAVSGDRSTSTVSREALMGRDLPAVGDLRAAALQRSAHERIVRPGVGSIAALGRRLMPQGRLSSLERRLMLAGRPVAWPIERILAAKVLLGGASGLLGFLAFNSNRSALLLLFWVALTAVGYFAPDLLLYSRSEERQKAIGKALPDTLDQMTISVEAGLGFESAMARAARSGRGALADELVRTLQELQIGVPRAKAMRNLADRTEQPDLRHFVLAVIQAESYGIPVADVLRTQAAEQRVKRRQRAEERAMKVPVKVIFPLILCILPTLFIVILGPAVIQIARTLFGSGGAL